MAGNPDKIRILSTVEAAWWEHACDRLSDLQCRLLGHRLTDTLLGDCMFWDDPFGLIMGSSPLHHLFYGDYRRCARCRCYIAPTRR